MSADEHADYGYYKNYRVTDKKRSHIAPHELYSDGEQKTGTDHE